MDWSNERWVKLYTRDTADWLTLSWQAQGLFALLLRKVNRLGMLDLGRHGKRGLAAHFGGGAAWASLEPALDDLLLDGCVAIAGQHLIIPNFAEAQAATQSPAQRKRTQRERETEEAESQNVTAPSRKVTERAHDVTPSHAMSHGVTAGHTASRDVTNRVEESRGEKREEGPGSLRDRDEATPQAPLFDDGEKPVAPRAKTTAAKARDGAEKAPAAPPLPFMPVDAYNALAVASGGRVATVTVAHVSKGAAIALMAQIRRFPDLAQWRTCGEWIGAGGERSRQKFGASWAASSGLQEAMAEAASWVERGRPALLDARGFPVVTVASAEPAVPDMWSQAMREAGVA